MKRVAGNVMLMTLMTVASIGLSARPAQAQTLFGVTSRANPLLCPSVLYTIDPATGIANTIGPIVGAGATNYCLVSAIAFDPTSGSLYGIGCRDEPCGGAAQLLTIDLTTAVATEIGPPLVFATDMSFRSDGTLYGYVPGPDFVFTVNKSTGAQTFIGPSGLSATAGNALAFSPDNVLLHADGGGLHMLNQTNGAATTVAPLGFPGSCAPFRRVNAMDFQPVTGTLFGVLNCNAGWRLGTINTSTGAIIDIGTTVNALDALAFQPVFTSAMIWVGLKNSDSVGLRLDLKAEVFLNNTLNPPAGIGELHNVVSGSSGFNNAKLNAIALALENGPVSRSPADKLFLRISVRRTCFGGGHTSGTVRLWYDGKAIDTGAKRDAGSRFGATLAGTTVSYFLRPGSTLSTTAGTSRKFIDTFVNSSVACPDRPFTEIGTWSTE